MTAQVGEALEKKAGDSSSIKIALNSGPTETVMGSAYNSDLPHETLEKSGEGTGSLTTSFAKKETAIAIPTSHNPIELTAQDSATSGLGGAMIPVPPFLENIQEVSAKWLAESLLNDTKGWEGWLKDLAQSHNDKVRFYGDVMDAFSQEHPCLAAIAQGIGDVEGLHPTFFPETKGEALSTGLALIAGKTHKGSSRPLVVSKKSARPLLSGEGRVGDSTPPFHPLKAVDKQASKGLTQFRVKVKKGEQPWTVRSGQEWKGKIVGRAQKTSTDGHALRSYRTAIKEAKKGDTEVVLLNRGVKRATGEQITPNTRPDVTVVRKDGKVDQFEVPSKTDKVDVLFDRMNDAASKFSVEKQGKNKVIKVTEEKSSRNDK